MVTALRAACAALCVTLAACGSGGGGTKPAPSRVPANLRLTSPDFKPGGTLPTDDTCDGSGHRPALNIKGVPQGAKALVVILHDPDAPGRDFTHWTFYDVPPAVSGIAAKLPPGNEGLNDFGKAGYGPPCPPKGDKPHHYMFELYALREKTGLPVGASPGDVRSAAERLALGRGALVATYGR